MEKVIVIGGGPAGLSAALYLARAGLSPLVFAGSPPGGQLMLTSEVENFPGHESILGGELVSKIRHQAEKFGAKIIDQNITKVDLSGSTKNLYVDKKNYQSKAILIATGAKALWLGIPGEEKLRGKGVSACATCDGFFFRDKIVAVVGGGDTAMEEALTLTKFAKLVYIIHRRNQFRASRVMQERVFNNPKIKIIWNAVVEEILGEKKVEAVRLKSVEVSQSQLKLVKEKTDFNQFQPIPTDNRLKIDGLFVAIGHKPDTDLFKGQIELDEKGYIITSLRVAKEFVLEQIKNSKLKIQNFNWQKKVDQFDFDFNYITSVPGVFAAGDCVDYKYRQAATAAGMGVAAALEIEKYLEESS